MILLFVTKGQARRTSGSFSARAPPHTRGCVRGRLRAANFLGHSMVSGRCRPVPEAPKSRLQQKYYGDGGSNQGSGDLQPG